MRVVPASVGSMIYRLNTIGVVVGGWILLDEHVNIYKVLGVTCGLGAVAMLYLGSLYSPECKYTAIAQENLTGESSEESTAKASHANLSDEDENNDDDDDGVVVDTEQGR